MGSCMGILILAMFVMVMMSMVVVMFVVLMMFVIVMMVMMLIIILVHILQPVAFAAPGTPEHPERGANNDHCGNQLESRFC